MSKGYYLMKCKASVLSILSLFMSSVLLTGCISDVWTGATMVYDRHNIYKKVGDFQLAADANRSLYKDQVFKRKDCSIELAVINGDMLLVGHVPTDTLRQEAHRRVAAVTGYRRLFNQLAVSLSADNTLQDDWITAKIRSRIQSCDLRSDCLFNGRCCSWRGGTCDSYCEGVRRGKKSS